MNMNESHMPFYGAVKYEEMRNITGQIHPKIKLIRHNEGLRFLTKPMRCTNFSNLFLEQKSTLAGSGCSILIPLASSQHNLYDIYLVLCIQYQTPDDGQRNTPKHAEFYSKNKFEKLVNLVGFIVRIYQDARYSECRKGDFVFATCYIQQP